MTVKQSAVASRLPLLKHKSVLSVSIAIVSRRCFIVRIIISTSAGCVLRTLVVSLARSGCYCNVEAVVCSLVSFPIHEKKMPCVLCRLCSITCDVLLLGIYALITFHVLSELFLHSVKLFVKLFVFAH